MYLIQSYLNCYPIYPQDFIKALKQFLQESSKVDNIALRCMRLKIMSQLLKTKNNGIVEQIFAENNGNMFGEIKGLLFQNEDDVTEEYIVYILELIENITQTGGISFAFEEIFALLENINTAILEEFGFSREAERKTLEILLGMLINMPKEILLEKTSILQSYLTISLSRFNEDIAFDVIRFEPVIRLVCVLILKLEGV